MAYDGKVMRRALRQFEADKQRRARLFAQRRTEIYKKVPRLLEIDALLRSTMSQIIAGALQKGQDPQRAIAAIRDNNLSLQRERGRLLRDAGYPEDALEEKPACPLCRDSGYRENKMCRCLQAYYTREQIAELSKMLPMGEETFDTFSFEWYSSSVEGNYGRSPRAMAEHHFDVCRDYANQFGSKSGNLLLFGNPGLGKTFLSACIARVVSEKGHSVVYDTASNIFSQFESSKFRRFDDDDSSDDDVNRYKNCDLLIIDDLGTEMLTSFVQSTLYQIINGRLISGRKTIISTNLSPEQIGKRYGTQILSRIEGEYEILPFIGKDIRLQKKMR